MLGIGIFVHTYPGMAIFFEAIPYQYLSIGIGIGISIGIVASLLSMHRNPNEYDFVGPEPNYQCRNFQKDLRKADPLLQQEKLTKDQKPTKK